MALVLSGIEKAFNGTKVLASVSLAVETGETLVLFGPSGGGKTVLLRLIAGVIEPDQGEIRIDGRDMRGVEPEDRGIGMAFQNFALFPHLDAAANIAAPLTARRLSGPAIRETVDRVARLLKIEHVLHHQPKALSNGQKQRTALARALAGQPSLLLLDDPLRNVDAKLRFEMRLELPRLLDLYGSTVVYVTQDYKEAMTLGDRIAVMAAGGIAQIGTPAEIYLSPASVTIARLFGDPAINLLDVRPARGAQGPQIVLADGHAFAIPEAYQGAIGADCLLGLRPELLHFVPAGTPGALAITVEAETPLNEKTVTLAITADRREILVSRPAGTPGPDHGPAFVAFDGASALLFDRASGARLEPADTATGPGAPG